MPRTLALDYGLTRTGLAWSDPIGLTAQPLPTVATSGLLAELARRITEGPVSHIVLGWPMPLDGRPDGQPGLLTPHIEALEAELRTRHPSVGLHRHDERFTSRLASQAIAQAGTRSQRRDKGLVDQVAAVLILREFLARGQ
jgi:putative Holliday junction resolvase